MTRAIALALAAVLAPACGRFDFGPQGSVADGSIADGRLTDAPATSTILNVGNNVQATNRSTGTPLTMTIAPTGQDHLLVLGLSWCCNTAVLPTISDDQGNVWRAAGVPITDNIDSFDYVGIAYSVGANPGVTQIVIDFMGFNADIFSEYANVDLSNPLDGYASALATNAMTGDSGPLTPSQAGDLLTAVGENDDDNNPANAGPGFDSVTVGLGVAVGQSVSMEYQVYGDTAPIDGTMQWGVPSSVPVAMAAFKAR